MKLSDAISGHKLPFTIQELEKEHAFFKAKQRHNEAGDILDTLATIEAFRLDAIKRMKDAEPKTQEHTDAASAFAILSAKRKEAMVKYSQYFTSVTNELRKA